MSRELQALLTIFDAKAEAATGTPQDVSKYRHLVLQFATASSANLTVKFQGSVQDTCPDFSAAQTATNNWDYIQVKDLQSGSSINGDTGVSPAGTDDFRLFELNTNLLKWVCATITTRAAGSLTLKLCVSEGV